MNLRQVLNVSMSGCIHEFHVADLMGVDRETLLTCHQCGVEATAGEVAWMLAGGQIVQASCRAEALATEALIELAHMPCEGGVN
jgi:hypothetical protein